MRWMVAALLVLMFSAASIGTAQAHAALVGSNPEDGATVDDVPAEVILELNEVPRTPSHIAVVAPDGEIIAEGEAVVIDRTVRLELPDTHPSYEPGDFTINYGILSADGHRITGTLTFTLSESYVPPAAGEDPVAEVPTDAADQTESDVAEGPVGEEADGGLSTGTIVIAGLIALAAIIAVTVVALRIVRGGEAPRDVGVPPAGGGEPPENL